jgi:hypothetical protein
LRWVSSRRSHYETAFERNGSCRCPSNCRPRLGANADDAQSRRYAVNDGTGAIHPVRTVHDVADWTVHDRANCTICNLANGTVRAASSRAADEPISFRSSLILNDGGKYGAESTAARSSPCESYAQHASDTPCSLGSSRQSRAERQYRQPAKSPGVGPPFRQQLTRGYTRLLAAGATAELFRQVNTR